MGDAASTGDAPGPVSWYRPVLDRLDGFQRRHVPTAVGVGVVKKFSDDRGGSLAAELTYYGFLSVFPLLLILTTVLGFIGNDAVADSVVGSALAQFPVFGDQIGKNVAKPLTGSGVGLAVGLLTLLYGALGSAQAAQRAMAQIWNIPRVDRIGFVPRMSRGLLFFVTLGVGMGLAAALSAVVTAGGHSGMAQAASTVGVIVLNIAMAIVAFIILTPGVAVRSLVPGAALAGFGYSLLLSVGTALVQRQLRHAEAIYGQFGLVLGLLAWLFLVARVSLYAAEVNVVLARRLWPRALTEPRAGADQSAGDC